ncbi:MAG: NAD(+) synthase [Candidatus Pacebacteria bacterium]|nr:NAD(+) synthase [Candidatus Paceibacterota bacterium]
MASSVLKGLKIGLCQQPCRAADVQANGRYFQAEIVSAEFEGVDLLVGVEGIQGYLIADQYEYPSFLGAVNDANAKILDATVGRKIAVAYGSVTTDIGGDKTGEDGRVLRHNGGFVFQDGSFVHEGNKTLSPNYRMFPEARYFFDNRKVAEKEAFFSGRPLREVLRELLTLATVERRNGQAYRLAQIFCEDMWRDDYVINPLALMAEQVEPGEEWVAINHSASPWTWRKNNKRHRVVKGLIQGLPVDRRPTLFVYVNRVGVEQSNKNFYIYDGSSAVYDKDGDLIFEVPPYFKGTMSFVFTGENQKIEGRTPDDTEALCKAMSVVIDSFYGSIPDEHRFVYVGLSGGIDSAVMATMLVSRLGPDRVIGVNMPYGENNSQEGKDDAKKLADNLGIKYLVIDITKSVDQDALDTGVEKDTLAHKNIQARHRMLKLAALAQKEEVLNGLIKKGGRFTANGNKIEMAFGYGTMYADIAGATMLFGDLVKREVYQLGAYLNDVIYRSFPRMIPESIFGRPPADELSVDRKKDPFDYGNLTERGYHDEWVRAVTEFRWDPMRLLTEYAEGTIEKSFMLPQGRIKKLFPTAKSFIERLKADWKMFTIAYWKRMQCPPVPIFSRRAFGGDLSESLDNFDPCTEDFKCLEAELLKSDQ